MRVLDAGSLQIYKMGKNKKHRIRKSKENEAEESSDDGGISCTHIPKAVNFASMRKALLKPTTTFGECSSCALEATKSGAKDLFGSPLEGAAASATEDLDVEPTIWVCLQCGHQGCDRNSRERHAFKHFETPHSCIHCIVVNITTWAAWCYTCDNDIPVEGSKRIMECIDFLRKQAGLPRLEMSHFQGVPRCAQAASPSDTSPTDPVPPSSPKGDKAPAAGKGSVPACQKVKGLSNLGNTCFFNAVMQNLCQTHSLETLLVGGCKKGRSLLVGGWRDTHSDSDSSGDGDSDEDSKAKELELIEIVPGELGPLTNSLLSFVQEMNNGTSYSTVTPNSLFSHVCKKAPRFKGYQQQDSHELLRYLIDVVRNEEIKRAQSGILKFFKLPESVNPKKVDDDTKTKIKEYGRQVKFTFLDSLFGGQLVSTITCEECKHISLQFESVLDLSLPVTEEKPQRPNQAQGTKKKELSVALQEAVEETGPAIGVDGFADWSGKPSKHQERKNKKQARKQAKKKGRHMHKGMGYQDKSREGDEDEKEEDGDAEEGGDGKENAESESGKGEAKDQTGNAKPDDGEEENSSSQEDPSDADVEDNLESETSRLNGGDFDSNLSTTRTAAPIPARHSNIGSNLHRCKENDGNNSDGEGSNSDLPTIKTGTVKENHILPTNGELSSGDSPPASIDFSVNISIKEEKNREVGKVANGISNLELRDCSSSSDGTMKDTPRDNSSARTVVSGGSTGSPRTPLPPDSRRSPELNFHSRPFETNHISRPVKPSSPGVGKAANGAWGDARTTSAVNGATDHTNNRDIDGGKVKKEADTSSEPEEATGLEKGFEEKLTLGHGDSGSAVLGGGSLANAMDKKFSLSNHQAAKSKKEMKKDARYKSKTTLAPRYHTVSKECSIMSCLHQFTAAELLTGSNKVICRHCNNTRPKNQAIKDKKGDAVYTNAAKQFLIMVPPAILTLHLKRFEQVGYTSRKVNRHVDFPLILDLAPYCSSLCQDVRPGQRKVLYSLYGVVEHSGRLQGGHYTAYVKVRPSLGPITNFLHQNPPSPIDYIHRYMEQLQNTSTIAEEVDGLDEPTADALVPPGRWFHVSDNRINEVTDATVLKAQAYLLFYERIY